MALTEAQKRYQNSPKGKAARAKYMAKRKERLAAAKTPKVESVEAKSVVEEVVTETPKE
jgi:hypothetical protein